MSILDDAVAYFADRMGVNRNRRKDDDDYVQVATLPHMDRIFQDKFARNVFKKLTENAKAKKGFFSNVATDAKSFEESLYESYKNMPEPIGDSFLITAGSAPVNFVNESDKIKYPSYSIFNGNVYLTKNSFLSLVHEFGHATMHRLNSLFPSKKIFVVDDPKKIVGNDNFSGIVDASVMNGVGFDFVNDISNDGPFFGGELVNNNFVFNNGNPVHVNDVVAFSKENYAGNQIGGSQLGNSIANSVYAHAATDPRNKVDYSGTVESPYKKQAEFYKKHYSSLGNPWSSFSASAMEDAANSFRIMGSHDGTEFMSKRMPSTYNKLMRLTEDDHRKKLLEQDPNFYYSVFF